MPISVDQFRTAATQLGNDAQIKLTSDQQGVATSKWERFQVWVGNLFSSHSTVAARQEQAIKSFESSLKAQYGQDMANIAVDHLRTELNGGPLTGRAIASTLQMVEGRGGQHWLKNERLINEFAHTVYPPREKDLPSLSSVVNPVAEAIIGEAQEKGLSSKQASEFLLQYTTGSTQVGVGFDMPDVSHAIENALRNAAIIKDHDGNPTGQYRALSREEARQIATDTAHSQILSRVNMSMGHAYLQEHSFNEAFDKMANERGLSDYRHLMDPGPVAETFTFAMQGAKTVVGMDGMPEQLDKVLSRYFDRQQEKLDQINQLKLPEGPALDNLIEGSLGVRGRMDQNYFKEVQNVTGQFASLKESLEKADNFEDQVKVITELGRAITDAMTKAKLEGADDMMLFLDQAFSIYAANAPKEDLQALADWMKSSAGEQVMDRMGDFMMRPEKYGDESLQQVGSIAAKALGVVSVMAEKLAASL